MPIKQIKLRGISRNPSDRVVEDGGCAESLNVHVEDGELVPTLEAKDVTESLGLPAEGDTYIPRFIHKMPSRTNFIAHALTDDGLELVWLSEDPQRSQESAGWVSITTLEDSTECRSIAAIGNTIIVVTDVDVYYMLFKDNEYKFLGSRIPEPKVRFLSTAENAVSTYDLVITDFGQEYSSSYNYSARGIAGILFTLNPVSALIAHSGELSDMQDYVIEHSTRHDWVEYAFNSSVQGYYTDEVAGELSAVIWDRIALARREKRYSNIFTAPLLVTYAVRLYDGTYTYHQSPQLLNGGLGYYFIAWPLRGTGNDGHMQIHLVDAFTAEASVDWDITDWEDIVSSVDICMSQDILFPTPNTKITGRTQSRWDEDCILFDGTERLNDEDAQLKKLLEASVFYVVDSITPDRMQREGSVTEILVPYSQDELFVMYRLPDGFNDMHHMIPAGETYAFNNRLLTAGMTVKPYNGNPYMQSQIKKASGTTGRSYQYVIYTIQTPRGETVKIYSVSASGGTFTPETNAKSYGLITYPDANCVSVAFYYELPLESYMFRKIEMKPHPSLNCAYAFLGMDVDLDSITQYPIARLPIDRSSYSEENKLFMSEVDNPFTFPVNARTSMLSKINAFVPVTVPLSAGQFGDYAIYLFTSDGIWGLSIDKDGTPGTPKPISSDVAVPGTVTQLENAACFISKKGVMIIQGSQVRCISPHMVGEHYVIEQPVSQKLSAVGSPWASFVNTLSDGTPFMAFMESARSIHDYAGNRLIFFNPDKPYQYAYMLESGTWHKLLPSNAVTLLYSLNSYPQAYVSVLQNGTFKVLNYATIFDIVHQSGESIKAVIATRAMDFNETDIRKALKTLRIRGHHNVNDVKYLLLASMDGINWGLLSTLRGGSYKLFRLIILADLAPTETISWIDVDYETRFTNRLR